MVKMAIEDPSPKNPFHEPESARNSQPPVSRDEHDNLKKKVAQHAAISIRYREQLEKDLEDAKRSTDRAQVDIQGLAERLKEQDETIQAMQIVIVR